MMKLNSRCARLTSLAIALGLAGCANFMPPTQVDAPVASQWQAPLPHQGKVGALSQWWQQQGDPLLVELIEAAQAVSPSVAQALSRVESARAARTSAKAALLPTLDASASATRGVTQVEAPLVTLQNLNLLASWELDLVGANRTLSQAADAHLQASQAQWHDARVSVAAEVATTYYSLSTCYQLLAVARQDAASRQETARLTGLSARHRFCRPLRGGLGTRQRGGWQQPLDKAGDLLRP